MLVPAFSSPSQFLFLTGTKIRFLLHYVTLAPVFAQRCARLDTIALESTTDQTPLFTWVTDYRLSLLQVYGYDRVPFKKDSTPLDESSNLRHAMEAAAVC